MKIRSLFSFWTAVLFILHMQQDASAQTARQVIQTVNDRFSRVLDYKADVRVECQIPSVKADPMNARVVYKKPDQFRVKAAGILVLPRHNMNYFLTTLSDTTKYTAVQTGEEKIGSGVIKQINVIPSDDTSDLILGKFWIDDRKGLVHKAQLTTKSQGTILIENTYGSMAGYALPDKMLFTIETQKFKLPKAVTMDIYSGSSKSEAETGDGKGRILLTLSNYMVNKGVSPAELQ